MVDSRALLHVVLFWPLSEEGFVLGYSILSLFLMSMHLPGELVTLPVLGKR